MLHAIMLFHIVVYADRAKMDHRHPAGSTARVASLPLGVFEATEDGSRKATEHPLYPLLHGEPNSEMTSFVLREVMLAHLLLYGNSYFQILRTGRNQVTGL